MIEEYAPKSVSTDDLVFSVRRLVFGRGGSARRRTGRPASGLIGPPQGCRCHSYDEYAPKSVWTDDLVWGLQGVL